MPKLKVKFALGIQEPAKLGTVILKPARGLSYAQNIDVQNDEYGEGVAVPGPALVTVAANAELTGLPCFAALFTESAAGTGTLWFAQSSLVLGAELINAVTGVTFSGSTAIDESTRDTAVAHAGHTTPVITDM